MLIKNQIYSVLLFFFTLFFTHSYASMQQIISKGSKPSVPTIIRAPKPTKPPKPEQKPISSPTSQPHPSPKPSTKKKSRPLLEKHKLGTELGSVSSNYAPKKPTYALTSKDMAEAEFENKYENYKPLIEKAKHYGLDTDFFLKKIPLVEEGEELSLEEMSTEEIKKLTGGISILENVVKTKDLVTELNNLIKKAQEMTNKTIDLEPFQEIAKSLINETDIKTLNASKDNVSQKVTELQQKIEFNEPQEEKLTQLEAQRIETERLAKEAELEAQKSAASKEVLAEKEAIKAEKEIETLKEEAFKEAREASKKREALEEQRTVEEQAVEKAKLKKEQLRLAEEAAQLKAQEELALKEKEEQEKRIAAEKEKLEKDIQSKKEIEEQIASHQQEQKQLELKQEEITDEIQQEQINKEITQNKTETEQLEQKAEEKTAAIEQQIETIKKNEAVLEQKTAEIEMTHSQKESLEKEKTTLKSIEKTKPKTTEPLKIEEATKIQQSAEEIKVEETKEKESKEEAQEKQEKARSDGGGQIPPVQKYPERAPQEKKEPLRPVSPSFAKSGIYPETVVEEGKPKIAEITPEITPEIIVLPKKEITPTIPESAEQTTPQAQSTEEPIVPFAGQPAGGTAGRWPKRPFSPYISPTQPPAFTPSIYGGAGAPSTAESIGGTNLPGINPYTHRFGLPPRVQPQEEKPVTEIKREKKIQPQDIVWWEKMLPEWVVRYLGRKDRTVKEVQPSFTKSGVYPEPVEGKGRPSTEPAAEEEKPLQKEETGVVKTIIEVIKKPIAEAINLIRSLFSAS